MASNVLDMRRPKLLVVSSTKELDKKALALSKKVMLPFFGNLESLKINSMNSLSGYFLVVSRLFQIILSTLHQL